MTQWSGMEGAGSWEIDLTGHYPVHGEGWLTLTLTGKDNFGGPVEWDFMDRFVEYE